MSFVDRIFNLVWDISDYFYAAWNEARDWIWPFSMLQYPLYALSDAFWSLLTPVAQFADWTWDVSQSLNDFLDRSGILSFLRTWLNYAEWAWYWILDHVSIIVGILEAWWSGTSSTVLAWIDAALSGAQALINQVVADLGNLRTAWDNFWTITWPALVADLGGLRSSWESFVSSTLPGLATWTGSQSLIESTLRTWFPFYDELAALWGEIRDMFTDPEDYLLRKLETMLARFW